MHFLFFAAQYLPTVGGVERYTHSLACALIKMGHSATVVTSKLPNLPDGEVTKEGINIYRLPSFLLMNGRFPLLKHGKKLAQQQKKLWQSQYDFAIINTHFYSLSLWAGAQCKKNGVPSLMLGHGTKYLSLDNALLDFFTNRYERFAMWQMRRNCKLFGGVSKACAVWLSSFNVQTDVVLYNAIDAKLLHALAGDGNTDFRKKLCTDDDSPLIAFTGRLIREKGVWELLAGFAELQKKTPHAVLALAGDGPLRRQIEMQNKKNVHVLGNIPYEESLALLSQCDVFCLPSYSEGFSGVILEAATLGACIVTTPTGGSPELISNGKSGILLEEISAKAVAGALHSVLQNKDVRMQMGAAVQAKVESKFTWQKTAQSLVKLAEKENGNEVVSGDTSI